MDLLRDVPKNDGAVTGRASVRASERVSERCAGDVAEMNDESEDNCWALLKDLKIKNGPVSAEAGSAKNITRGECECESECEGDCDCYGACEVKRAGAGGGGRPVLSDATFAAINKISAAARVATAVTYGKENWRPGGGAFDTGRKCDVCDAVGKIHVDDGHHVCRECCSILERVIDTGAEWRYYGAEDSRETDPTRCGMPTNHLMPKSSLGSVIGGQRRDHKDMRRIRRFQLWNSMPHSERALYNVFDQIKVNTVKYGLPAKVVDDAIVLYKKASEQKISRGENKEGLIASCIYHACLINKVARSAKEVSQMFGIDGMVLTKGNARFQNLLHMNVDSAGPDDFIGRFGSKLNMDYDDIQKCRAFVKRLDEMEIVSENAPTSVAAGALYYYCVKKKIPGLARSHIATVCEVSEVTIVKCYKRLTRFREVDEACVV